MGKERTSKSHPHDASLESAESCALAAVAHELKNPLQAMGNLLHLIATDPANPSLQLWVKQAQQEVERVRQIVAALLQSSRRHSPPSDIELAEILEASLRSFSEKIEYKNLMVEKRLECTGAVRSVAVEVRHVFDNVIINALEAVPAGGRILVHLRESRDWVRPDVRGCRLVVFDNGPGIPPEQRHRIFESFFTTKLEKGTGIGLWVVQRILKKLSGTVHVRSSLRPATRGTAFSIFLPAAMPEADQALHASDAVAGSAA